MTDDLTDRLRYEEIVLCDEAADEIDRLRTTVCRLLAVPDEYLNDTPAHSTQNFYRVVWVIDQMNARMAAVVGGTDA